MIKLVTLILMLSISSAFAGNSDSKQRAATVDHSAQPSKVIKRSKLEVIKQNCRHHYSKGTFKTVLSRLQSTGISVFEFYNAKECEIDSSDDSTMKKYKPVHLLLLNPNTHNNSLMGMMNYFRKKLKRIDLLQRILNEKDEKGRTMLDFLEELRERNRDNPSIYRALAAPRQRMCQYGGVHSTPRSDCKKLKGL